MKTFYMCSIELIGMFDIIHPNNWAKNIIPDIRNNNHFLLTDGNINNEYINKFHTINDNVKNYISNFVHNPRKQSYRETYRNLFLPIKNEANNIRIYGNYAIIFTIMALWFIFVNMIVSIKNISILFCRIEFENNKIDDYLENNIIKKLLQKELNDFIEEVD
jgi:hypothetical protein